VARTRATALAATALALGLAGVGALPFVMQSASASVTAYDPGGVPGCNPGDTCDTAPDGSDPVVTVTTTTTPDSPSTDQPEVTVTRTVTGPPKKKTTSAPTPKKTPTPKVSTPKALPSENFQPLPTPGDVVPSVTEQPTQQPTQEPSVSLPAVATTDAPTSPPPSSSGTETESDPLPLELRAATPEYDQKTVAQKLSIPALILVLLALFAVLIFEGRLRRMAHAAAVRKAGPLPDPNGYPAGPGYAGPGYPGPGYPGPNQPGPGYPTPGYPGGTAYAPIISFVPVQTYPSGQVQYGPVYHDQTAVYEHQGYPPDQQPPAEPMVLHPDEFDSFSHEPPPGPVDEEEVYRDPFEPLIPAEPPPADIPPGGAAPYTDTPEVPLGTASAAETGDSEPWQEAFQASSGAPPSTPPPDSSPGPTLTGPLPSTPTDSSPGPTLTGPLPSGPPPDDDVTAVQPLPAQEKRGRRGRRK
jgi:hypothetical protein